MFSLNQIKYWKKGKTNVVVAKNKTVENKETDTIIISGLPDKIHEVDLYEVFSRVGSIDHIFLCNSHHACFKCAFIRFFDIDSAMKAIQNFNNKRIGYITLDVNFV